MRDPEARLDALGRVSRWLGRGAAAFAGAGIAGIAIGMGGSTVVLDPIGWVCSLVGMACIGHAWCLARGASCS